MRAVALLATITIPGAAAGTPAKDGAALVDLYHSLGGEKWPHGSKKWDVANPSTMCSWHNVTCDTDGRVSKLDFTDMHYVEGTLPNSVVDLDALVHLRFKRNNKLSGTVPDKIGKMENLETLVIGRNQVSGTIPFSVYGMKSLKTLYFKQNRMSGTLSEALGNLKQLKTLDLRESKFYGQVPESLSTMARLEVLNLEDNAWRGFLPIPPGGLIECELTDKEVFQTEYDFRAITPLKTGYGESNSQFFCPLPEYVPEPCKKHLYCTTEPSKAAAMGDCAVLYDMYLSMNGPKWENADDKSIKWSHEEHDVNCCEWDRVQCRSQDNRVKGLDLRGIKGITGTLPPSIGKLDKLTGLRMKSSPISGTIPDEIGLLSKLQALEIGRNKVSGTIPFSIYGLSELDELYLKQTKMSGTISEAIGAVKKLQFFDIRESSFEGTLPQAISYLENLEQFNIEDNKFRGFLPELSKGVTECALTDKTFSVPYDEIRRTQPQGEGWDAKDARFKCPLPKSLPEACQSTAFCTTDPLPGPSTPYAPEEEEGPGFMDGLKIGLLVMAAVSVAIGCVAFALRKTILRLVMTESKPFISNEKRGSSVDPAEVTTSTPGQ